MGDEVKDELKRQSEAARKSWWTAIDKARSEGLKAQRETETSMGVAELRAAYDAAERRISDHAAKGLPPLPDGWAWDEYGRAVSDEDLVDVNGDLVEFEDDDCNTQSRPIAVVLAVIASKESK